MKRRASPGAPPGILTVDPDAPRPVIKLMAYGPDRFVEHAIKHPDEIKEFLGQWPVCWVDIDGLGDALILERIAALFGLHPLAMEDVVNTHQRAKVDQFGDRTYVVTHMVSLNEHFESEQVSLFLGPNFVVTFQERPGDCLEPVRERIRKHVQRVRESGPGYLAYMVLDAVIDHYFPVLEAYGERLETLEDRIIALPDRAVVAEIHEVKRELLYLRRAIWPQREALNTLVRDEIPHIGHETRLYLRDVYDHAVRIIDLVETYREVCSDLMDLYLSSISNRMNEVMKVLTVISTIFIPLTFIVGLYGMNFNPASSPWNMPELNWYWGYPVCLVVMVIITIGQFIFFRRKGWIGGTHEADEPPTPSP
ncbi:MAG: magnesium/cobalt transporter CorA [Planctomycetaceae bacterium]|nr:magnesium/cobalt transporter CorA [Planctomycetaceae bacterium]